MSNPSFLDETHDPARRSWVESANEVTDFPIQNLPFGVFRAAASEASRRVGVAIGDQVLDVTALAVKGMLDGDSEAAARACRAETLNTLMSLGRPHWSALRRRLSDLLRAGSPSEGAARAALEPHLLPQRDVEMGLPAEIGDYTDFYASVFHATNVGRMLRPDNPLLPNYKWVPVGYHGRASSIVPSGTAIRRPHGQLKPEGADAPIYGPTGRLDYELELAAFIGPGNPLGETVSISRAEAHVFGLCLLNDWSARDVQAWEYQPLGPFLAKSFATTISPWVVTLEALAPFRVPPFDRPAGDPPPLPHLDDDAHRVSGGVDVQLEVLLQTERMRRSGCPPSTISRASLRDMYWTFAQFVVHHTSNGCNLRPGDLLASGTASGEAPGSRGCLLELAWRGERPIELPGGERRAFLADGDEVTMRAWCAREGAVRLGFGECRGSIVSR